MRTRREAATKALSNGPGGAAYGISQAPRGVAGELKRAAMIATSVSY